MTLEQLTTRDDIGKVLTAMGLTGTGVEVGVAFGENAEVILDGSSLKTLLLVDPWDYVPNENPLGFADAIKNWGECFAYAKGKLERFKGRAQFMRMSSVQAAACVVDDSLDFVYIDANHMSPYVDNDLAAWWPKVKHGGVFGGHDYMIIDKAEFRCDVKTAVDKFFANKQQRLFTDKMECQSWYVVK